jgi:PBP1b-binding outer membrane lipoprotein LpoB
MKTLNALLLLVPILFIAACSDNSDGKASGNHVWKEQTETIDKAREVEALMLKTAEDQAKTIEEQMQ